MTALHMTSLDWLGRKTSTQTNTAEACLSKYLTYIAAEVYGLLSG